MITAVRHRSDGALGVALAAGSALLFGAIVGTAPVIAIGLLGVGLVIALAFLAPVVHIVA